MLKATMEVLLPSLPPKVNAIGRAGVAIWTCKIWQKTGLRVLNLSMKKHPQE